MVDSNSPKKPDEKKRPRPIEELRQMVREDIEEQRKIADGLRRKLD